MSKEKKEIDLVDIIKILLQHRWQVLKVSLFFLVVGVGIAILSPKEFTASTIMIPQVQKTNVRGDFSNLAAIAGINLNTPSSDIIPVSIYPKVISSVPFKKELLKTKLNFEGEKEKLTYIEFYSKDNELEKEIDSVYREDINDTFLNVITENELKLFKKLDKQIKFEVDEKTELIKLGVSMPEALASAQMTEAAKNILQKIITDIKIKKAKGNFQFIEKNFLDSKENFEAIDKKLARFRDSNRGLITSESRRVLSGLENEYNLSFQIYSELSKRLETQKIKLEETTPVFSIIEPVIVPLEKSKPKRLLIVIMFTFLGLVISSSYVVVKGVFKK